MTHPSHKAGLGVTQLWGMIPWYPDRPTAYAAIREYMLSLCTRWVPGPRRAIRLQRESSAVLVDARRPATEAAHWHSR